MCERNDDVTYYASITAYIAAFMKVSRHELAVVSMQHVLREGTRIPEAKVGICQRLVQRKRHTGGLFPV